MIGMTFGEAIREARRSLGISQRELAERLHVDARWLNDIERDRLRPPADYLEQIARETRIDLDYLVTLARGWVGPRPHRVVGKIVCRREDIELRNAQSKQVKDAD